MVRVAVAGGSASIGRAIVNAIETKGLHECIILSRSSKSDAKVKNVVVDYSDINGLLKTLEAEEIHTVICATAIHNDASGEAQMNLIEAAEQCSFTKRFMPTEFGIHYKPGHFDALPYYAWKFKAADRLEKTNLEYTRFSNGMFMDYWFAPRIPSAFSFNVASWVDIDNDFAAIPGDGNAKFALTHSRDVGRFVAEILELTKWEKRYYLAGDRLSINEFLHTVEEAKGVSFEKHSDSIEKLRSGVCTLLPAVKMTLPEAFDMTEFTKTIAAAGARTAVGDHDLPTKNNLNTMFPHIKTLTVKEAVRIYFKN